MIELMVVLIIGAILLGAVALAYDGAQDSARARAMEASAATIDVGVEQFQKVHPAVAGGDPLVQRMAGQPWNGDEGINDGMVDLTGEQIVYSWPDDPYSNDPVQVYRFGPGTACVPPGNAIGRIAVCRVSAARAGAYRVRAWADDGEGNAIIVYDVQRG